MASHKPRIIPFILSVAIFGINPSLADKLPRAMVANSGAEIDYIIETANKEKKIDPNPIIDDATFLRRSYLNIIGRVPTFEETKKFLDDKRESKRADLIDELIYSPGYSSHQFNFYANLLRLKTNDEQYGLGWHQWLRDSVRMNKPYDVLVYEMLSANGHSATVPQVGYYLRDRGMLLDNISNTAQVFLGTRIGCAQCHDDPFEDWTQKQYYELAAFGAHIEYRSNEVRTKVKEVVDYKLEKSNKTKTVSVNKKDAKKAQRYRMNLSKQEARDLNNIFRNLNRNALASNEKKSLRLPDDYQYNDAKPKDIVTPHVLFGAVPTKGRFDANTPQEQMAAWVTSKSNPMFSKVIANRLWKQAFGYALVEPVDNWTDRSNIAHPEALDTIIQILHSTNFDTREALRVMYHTKLFQREVCKFEITDGRIHDFRGPLLRRMSAEQVYDSLITLEKGNVDEQSNEDQNEKWSNFKQSVASLLNSSPQQIIKIDNHADRVEDATREHRDLARKLRLERDTLLKEGKKAEASRVQTQLRKTYETINKIRKEKETEESKELMMVMRNKLQVRSKTPLRASEMPTPFNPGTLARDFGASDRNTTNAQHTHASVPQALLMLNGYQISRITDQKGNLAAHIKKSRTPEERLDTLFLSIYNAYPSNDERTMLKYYARSAQDIKILAKSMLNSKRFLYIE